MSDETTPEAPAPPPSALVLLGLPLEAPSQRRWTVLLRVFLVLPLAFVGVWWGLVGLVNVIAAWFAALFTKRVPDSIQKRLTGILRWQARVSAYSYLLTDTWPGAHLAYREGDRADLRIDHVELRRSAVFFRVVLVIPAVIVQYVLDAGLWVFVVVMWFAGLFRGRCPRTLHQAVALVLRYSIRTTAYQFLLTPTMPFAGLFGDGVEAPSDAPPPTDAPAGNDVSTEVADSEPWSPDATTPAPAAGPDTLPATWLVSPRVRTVLVWVIVLGAVGGTLNGLRDRSLFTWGTAAHNRSVVVSANNQAALSVRTFSTTALKCKGVSCVQGAARVAEVQVDQALGGLSTGWNGSTTTLYRAFDDAMRTERTLLTAMGEPTTSLAREQTLYADLVNESRLQYAAVLALLKTL